jgi:hypothetical protein
MKTSSLLFLALAGVLALFTLGCETGRTERSFSIGNRGWNYSRGTDTYATEQWVPGGKQIIVHQNGYSHYNEWNNGPTYYVPQVEYVQPTVPPPVYWPNSRR